MIFLAQDYMSVALEALIKGLPFCLLRFELNRYWCRLVFWEYGDCSLFDDCPKLSLIRQEVLLYVQRSYSHQSHRPPQRGST